MFEKIKAVTCRHYENVLMQYGDSPQGINWSDVNSQRLRFQILSEVDDLNGQKIHEVGCGLAHFVDFLAEKGINCEYVGSDISTKMIQKAKQRLPQAQLYVADILEDITPDWMRADYLLASGVFNAKMSINRGVWQQFVEAMFLRMFSLARKGIAFNLITSYVDYENSNLFYLSPAETLDFCIRNLGRRVVIRHDYPLWEYTVYVYKTERGIK